MAPPKRTPAAAASSSPSKRPASRPSSSSSTPPPSSSSSSSALTVLTNHYLTSTPQRTKLIDAFMGFLVLTGVLQFAYCIIAGNYPFNAFLAGFSATVGQFVLTASLRMQSNPANKTEFKEVSQERAFADFIFGSLILHFFCINFIN